MAVDRGDAQKRREALEVATDAGHDGMASWRKPLPLVICGEGKHRAEMHQEYFADMLVNLEVDPMPPAQELRMRPVLGASNLIALEWRPPEGPPQTCLLPFPELSQPLLQAHGVRVSRLPWVPLPWSPLIQRVRSEACCGDERVPSSIELCLRPARLRRYMLMGGYR